MNHHIKIPSQLSNPVVRLKRLISVCEIKDIEVWAIASRRIVRNIDAEKYCLICPNSQVDDFKRLTDANWTIQGEGDFASNCHPSIIQDQVSGANSTRVNWLFQQFLKINAILESELGDDELVLIWDADTVPLRKINFINPVNGLISYYHGSEHHIPYFETIRRVLGLEKLANESFVAQCMPIRVGWLKEMVNQIEIRFGNNYVDSILSALPGNSGSEFSEYETIGAWVLKYHRNEMEFRKKNFWLRSGSTIIGQNLSGIRARIFLNLLGIHYDFVAIENWKNSITVSRIIRAIVRRLEIRVRRTL